VMETLPGIRDIISETVRDYIAVTWFVRSDSQVAENTGSAAGLVRGWSDFWEEMRNYGDEIAWHPHLYRRRASGWTPIQDPKKLAAEAERVWNEITSEGWRPVTSRIGESVGSTELMIFLDSTGIKADSTALPGRKRDDGVRRFDWTSTPTEPYHPARCDYSRPPRTLGSGDRIEGEEALGILEIPFTMARIRAPYDPTNDSGGSIKRYIDLSYDPARLADAMKTIPQRLSYLTLVVHPLQASGREIPDGGLVAGGHEVLRKNMRTIMGTIERMGRSPIFLTMAGFRKMWLGEKVEYEEGEFPEEKQKSSEKREKGDERKKGGIKRAGMEGDKAQRRMESRKTGVRADSRRRRQDPRRRRG